MGEPTEEEERERAALVLKLIAEELLKSPQKKKLDINKQSKNYKLN